MPAATTVYRIAPASLAKLQPGDTIVALLNPGALPETLSDVRVVASTSLVSALPVTRSVTLLRVGDVVPQASFVDQTGTPFTLSKYEGDDVVLAFIYTRCRDPQECPLTSAKFGELQTQLRGRNAHLIEVTLDPKFDTPAVLARYARLYNADPARWTFATGKPSDVLNFAASFGLQPFYDPRVGFIHGETLATIDQTGAIHDLVYTNSWQPSEIVAALNAMDHLASNPLARLNLWLSKAAVAICGNGLAGPDGLKDLVIMVVIVLVFGWLLWRIYRALGLHVKEP